MHYWELLSWNLSSVPHPVTDMYMCVNAHWNVLIGVYTARQSAQCTSSRFSSPSCLVMQSSQICSRFCDGDREQRYIISYSKQQGIQWNPSKADTIATKDFVLYREVSLTQEQPRPYQDRGQGCGLRVYGQYLTILLSVWGDSTILAYFRAKSLSERMLTLFCNENFKIEAGFTAGCG